MKKLFFTVALLLVIVFAGTAQNRSIDFDQTKEWKQIVAKAKAENKLIFLDCYTDWCSSCIKMIKTVFMEDEVADFFNENFVSAKFEMDHETDGIMLRKEYAIMSYPTMLFIDPVTGDVVHKMVGAGDAEYLLSGAREALDPQKNLSAMVERYKSGDRNAEFIIKYIHALRTAFMKDEVTKVTLEYLDALTAEQLATQENWLLMRDNVTDPLSKPWRLVMANRPKFYDVMGQRTVDNSLESRIMGTATTLARMDPAKMSDTDIARVNELTQYLRSIDYPATAPALAYLETAEFASKGDWGGFIEKMREVEASNVFNGKAYYSYFQSNIESLVRSNDKKIIAQGVKLIDEKIAQAGDNHFDKVILLQNKRRLYASVGDQKAVDKVLAEREKLDRERKAPTGGGIH